MSKLLGGGGRGGGGGGGGGGGVVWGPALSENFKNLMPWNTISGVHF